MVEQGAAVADETVEDLLHRLRPVQHVGREHLHELARHAVVVRHRDQREGKLVDVGIGLDSIRSGAR